MSEGNITGRVMVLEKDVARHETTLTDLGDKFDRVTEQARGIKNAVYLLAACIALQSLGYPVLEILHKIREAIWG